MFLTFKEVYQYREVLWNLFSQDFKVKYKRTFFGFFWSLLNPICYLLVLSAVFSNFVRLGTKDYPKYLFAGLLPWMYFQSSISSCVTAFIDSENFLKKVYLPKALFPLSKTLIRSFDFLISFFALLILGGLTGFGLSWECLLLPLAILPFFFFTLGAGVLASIVTVYFRDMVYLMNIFLQLLYFLTPILYPLSSMPPKYRMVLQWNPLTSLIGIFQKLIYENQIPTPSEWAIAYGIAFTFLIGSLLILNAKEQDLVFRL